MKNRHTSGVQMPNHAGAKMPANNVGTFQQPLGTTHNSKFQSAGPDNAPRPHKSASKANMPAKNAPSTGLPLGTTKHGVGQVPGYLRGKK